MWDKINTVLNMGGYAATVWPAYGCFLGLLLINHLRLTRLKRKLINENLA